jgi:hypothetical protein
MSSPVTTKSTTSATAAALVGLRRVDWIRLLVDEDHVGAEAVGVGFRLPATCPIPMSVATRLIASGVPHVTRHLGTRATWGHTPEGLGV